MSAERPGYHQPYRLCRDRRTGAESAGAGSAESRSVVRPRPVIAEVQQGLTDAWSGSDLAPGSNYASHPAGRLKR